MQPDIESIRRYFADRAYLLTLHASNRAVERAILSREIEEAVANGEIIEEYPTDKYGPTCLILGKTESQRVLHVLVSYPEQPKVVTVYEPSPDEWEADWKTRKR